MIIKLKLYDLGHDGDLLITPSLALKHNDCVTEVSLDAVPVWFLHM